MSTTSRISRSAAPTRWVALGLSLLLTAGSLAGQSKKTATVNHADAQLRLGKFVEAEQLAAAVLEKEPTNFRAALIQARVALLQNRLDDAKASADRAAELRPTHSIPKEALAEISYRRDEFARAAELLRQVGKKTRAAQLESFDDRSPYHHDDFSKVELEFVQTDPLPVVRVGVNGSEPAAFLLDTGGGEIIVNTEWAAELGIQIAGSETGTFAGGRQASVGYGRADSVTLGELELKDVPVQLLDTTPFAAVAPELEIRGVLGTVLFYHFLTTIDYPGGRLILRPRGTEAAAGAAPLARIPFLLAGDHYILAEGEVNGVEGALFLVDTGLAGLGFTCPRSTLEKADVTLIEAAAGKGIGGGGAVQAVPFLLESLSLGSVRREQIPGVFGPFPPALEHSKGFRIGGMISHGFFRPFSITFDFDAMELVVHEP